MTYDHDVPRYTLAEARRILCAERGGHELEQIAISTRGGVTTTLLVRCEFCRTEFKETNHV